MVNYIVKNRFKDATDFNVSNSAVEEMNNRIEQILKEAERRAEGNDRSTIMDRDI